MNVKLCAKNLPEMKSSTIAKRYRATPSIEVLACRKDEQTNVVKQANLSNGKYTNVAIFRASSSAKP